MKELMQILQDHSATDLALYVLKRKKPLTPKFRVDFQLPVISLFSVIVKTVRVFTHYLKTIERLLKNCLAVINLLIAEVRQYNFSLIN